MNKTKLPSIFAVLFMVAGLVAGVLMVRYNKEYRTKASGDIVPKNVRITNITDTSFSVSWMTEKMSTGFLKYKKSGETNKVELDKIDNDSTHFVEISNLEPSTTYYFSIGSEDQIFDNNGASWQVKTGDKLQNTNKESIFATGKVTDSLGNPIKNALVHATSQSSSTLSTYTSEKGSWIINLSNFRGISNNSGTEVLPTSILEISIQKKVAESSSAKVQVKNSNPVPTIVMGEVYDFRNVPEASSSSLPSAILNLPENSTNESELK